MMTATSQASTGDLKNLLLRLYAELRAIKFKGHVEPQELCSGIPAVYLQLIHFALLDAFPEFTADIVARGYDLRAKRDKRFMETVYRLLRDEFSYKPAFTRDQFFNYGFAARKILFLLDLFGLVKARIDDMDRRRKRAGATVSAVKRPTSQQQLHELAPPSRSASAVPSVRPHTPSLTSAQVAAASGTPAHPFNLRDISFTVPVPASPSSAPAPSSPPRRPHSSASLISRGGAISPPSDQGSHLDHDENAAALAAEPMPEWRLPAASVPLFTRPHSAAPALPGRPGAPSAASDLEVAKILANVTTSLARLDATLRGMQSRLDKLESVQEAVIEKAKRGEEERVRLLEQNQMLRNENARLVQDVTLLRGGKDPAPGKLVPVPAPSHMACPATATATRNDTRSPAFPMATTHSPPLSHGTNDRHAFTPSARSPLVTVHPRPTSPPTTSRSSFYPSGVHPASSPLKQPYETRSVSATPRLPLPADPALDVQMAEAEKLREAINLRLATTQALLARRSRSTA